MSDLGRYLAFWPMPRARANRWIDAGDAARNAGAWQQAAAHYRRAVTIQPRRRPIWIQLGHAEKEAGQPQAALEAYARASLLPADDGEAWLYYGLHAKALGQFAQAKSILEKAFRQNPAHPDARREWQVMLHHPLAASEEDKVSAAALLHADQLRLDACATAPDRSRLVFDVTDLLHHCRNARLPTGVQRVQMEVICAAILLHPGLRICCFTGDDAGWARVPLDQFVALCELARADDDMFETPWIRAAEMLAASVALAAPVGFAAGDVLVNLGTSWIFPNYFLHIRHARRSFGIRYVPFVHDVIPVVAPQYCLPGVVRDYLGWIGGVFDHADRLLTNSRSTAADVLLVAKRLGHRLDEGDLHVIPLDAALPAGDAAPLPVSMLDRWNLSPEGYVLFVSSIEPRKNHRMAFRAWQAMIAHDAANTPDLICVGSGGWLNGPIHAMLRDNPALASKIRILSDISDAELALLYRHCRFTIYPSHYEGWGIPVTEALCHGKVPVVTRTSSLMEAGGNFAIYVEPDDDAGLAAAVEALWRDPDRLSTLETRIRRDFQPRAWADIALQVQQASQGWGASTLPDMPSLRLHALHRISSNRAMHLVPGAQIGDMLRHDLGWETLEAGQCRTGPEGGALAFHVVGNPDRVFCHLRFSGCDEGPPIVNGPQTAHRTDRETGWISLEVPVIAGRVDLSVGGGSALSHLLVSDSAELTEVGERMVAAGESDYAFVRDLYPLIMGREASPVELADVLPSLDTGGLSRNDVLTMLRLGGD